MKRCLILLAGLILGWPMLSSAEESPAAAPAAAAPAAAAPIQDLKVQVKVGSGIENREVTGEAESFDSSTSQLIGWSLIEGANEPTEIVHEWLLNGSSVSSVTLPVKSSHYRTFSRKTLNGQAGSWEFQVKDSSGAVLASKKFEVTTSAVAPAAEAPAVK